MLMECSFKSVVLKLKIHMKNLVLLEKSNLTNRPKKKKVSKWGYSILGYVCETILCVRAEF